MQVVFEEVRKTPQAELFGERWCGGSAIRRIRPENTSGPKCSVHMQLLLLCRRFLAVGSAAAFAFAAVFTFASVVAGFAAALTLAGVLALTGVLFFDMLGLAARL